MSGSEERTKLADFIRRFANDEVGRYEWDDMMSSPFSDRELEAVRQECIRLFDESLSRPDKHNGVREKMLEVAARLGADVR